jgi:hypothetical protein
MAMKEVGYAKLHDDLFLNGKNFGKGLDAKRHGGIKLVYDSDEKELLVTWMGKTAHVPSQNVASYCVGEAEDRKVNQVASPMVAGVSGSAQVGTPMSHVHAGPGAGKTGK